LELKLDELRIIQEAEGVIDSRYRDFVTPNNEGGCVTVRGKGRGGGISSQCRDPLWSFPSAISTPF